MSKKSFLLSIDSKKIKYGLSRTKALLHACRHPEKKLLSIQIVGTNGKGSTAAMLANVFTNNNYRTGLFTSPHLVSLNERIRINHRNISNLFIEKFLNKYKEEISSINPSFFEIMTVLSLYYFAKKKVDIAILETGLGGALDSVTAAEAKIIIFTPIDYDHMSILGDSLEKIAIEKGGSINNENQILISCTQHHAVKKNLNTMAVKKNNRIFYQSRNSDAISLISIEHQNDNARLVIFALKYIQSAYQLKCQHITNAIQNTFWPGRLQTIQESPDIIFDVAHNSHSLRAFIKYFHKKRKSYKKTFLILGFEEGKDIIKELPTLYDEFDYIYCTETKIRNSMPSNFLFNLYQPKNKNIHFNPNPEETIQKTIKKLTKDDILVILGSHYFGPYIHKIYKNCFDIQLK